MKIELTQEEAQFIGFFLEEYYNGDSVCGENDTYDKLANSISKKLMNASNS